ncbi:MAG: enoyl-CoA hydratase/isomerase family protein, partial [Nitrososphaerales archaeon]
MFKFIIFERKQDYAKITINRPEVMNALNIELRKEIIEALSGVEKDEQVRAVVLTGAGEKAFSAGADIKMFQTMTPFIAKEYLKTSKGASSKIENFPKPVIAAVNGYAIGGGLELAMSCDIIIASDNAKFGQGEINVGAIPGVGGTQRLPRLVGLKKAKEMIFTGELVDAKTALEMGL